MHIANVRGLAMYLKDRVAKEAEVVECEYSFPICFYKKMLTYILYILVHIHFKIKRSFISLFIET